MALAIALILLVIASVLFQIYSPWWFTPVASNWGNIDDTFIITGLVTGAFFIGINLFIAYAIIRFRHKPGHKADYQPENKKLEWTLIGLTSVGIIAMLAPGLLVYSKFVSVPEDAETFEVVGQQWQWSFRFPGDDGQLGSSDARLITPDNPLGVNPDDPRGQDDRLVLSNELHLAIDQPVKALMRSKDVLHNFYVPQFRVKMDMVPGQVSYIWFTPIRTGRFEILCAELCGLGHYNMRGHVSVESAEQYQTWLTSLPTFAQLQQRNRQQTQTLSDASPETLLSAGAEIAQAQGCLGCHSLDGSKGVGPSWLNLYGNQETLIDGQQVLVDADYLIESILNPAEQLVRGYPPAMPPYRLNSAQLQALVAYMQSLSTLKPPRPTSPPETAEPTTTNNTHTKIDKGATYE